MRFTIWEDDAELEETPLPEGLVLAWDSALPDLEVEDALGVALWLGVESKWVVTAPLLSEVIVSLGSCQVVTKTVYRRLTSPPGGGSGKEP